MSFLLKSLVLILVVFSYQNSVAQESWTQKAEFPGGERWGAISFSINGKIYVGMGNDGTMDYGDLWEYDPATNSWNQKADYPINRRLATSFSINGKGYVCCGINSIGLLNDVIEYNPSTNTWTAKASLPSNGRYGASGFSMNEKGYICCGNLGTASGPYTNELWEYDPQVDFWNAKADFIGNARFGITNTAFVIGNKAFTGMGVSGSTSFNDMYAYNQPTNSWTAIANYPGLGRAYLSGFTLCDSGYLGTGQINSIAFSDFWKYDSTIDTWSQIGDFDGNTRWLMIACESNGHVYVGTGDDFSNYYSDWWEFSCSGVGINEIVDANSISISPNPFSIQTNLQFENQLKDACIKLYDIHGKIMREINHVNGKSLSIDRENLIEGIYFIRIHQENEISLTVKIVVLN